MGRTKAAQKHKRAEKAKVKLKGHATKFLPKGKNITDTTFKVRKIVLQEQLKTPDSSQLLSKRKLSVKEVLTRLEHYSSSQRQEGLHGLRELLCQMDKAQLTSQLPSIVDNLARLSLDPEASVRKQSAHILMSVLSLVSETQLLPFSTVLGSYLSCAMTHITLGVQEDSLLLFDALLENAPSIAAVSANQLLPCVLDMISQTRSDHHASRELSVQLSSNLISSTWRAKVFGRLQALLVVSLHHRTNRGVSAGKGSNEAHYCSIPITVDTYKQMTFPLYNSSYATPVCLSKIFNKSVKSTRQLLDDDAQLCKFVESIMPLMLDSWMEVNPLSFRKSNQKTEDSGLPLESAFILHCILEIIDLLWQHLDSRDNDNARQDLTNWFKYTYLKDVNKYLKNGFPYAARVAFTAEDELKEDNQSRKRRSKANNEKAVNMSLFKLASPFFLKDKDEQSCTEAIAKCVLQNLTLCHLLANMSDTPALGVKQKILEILISYLNQWGGSLLSWSYHLLRALRSVFERSSQWGCNLDPLLAAVVSRYDHSSVKQSASHQTLASQLCDLLGEVSAHPKYQHLQGYESFHSWIRKLPLSLSRGPVTLDKLCVFNKLASHKNVAFLEGLQVSYSSILDSICNFQPLEGENVSEKEAGLASLFYWLEEWNENRVSALKDVLLTKKCSSLTKRISSILLLQQDMYVALGNALWLKEGL